MAGVIGWKKLHLVLDSFVFLPILLTRWRRSWSASVNYDEHAETTAANASDTPHAASRFDCYRSPVPLIVGKGLV